jgi:parallel beta-helix repeat protein
MKPHVQYILGLFVIVISAGAAEMTDALKPGQLPDAMHNPMPSRPRATVGVTSGDFKGADNRAVQAAVDYVAGLGGGIVEIGPGEYLMHDSLHLRSHVTVRGTSDQTILRKARGAVTALKIDGDYGEEQITLENPAGFEIGDGVAIWDDNARGFLVTVARITGQDHDTFSISLPLGANCLVKDKAHAATVFPVVSGYYLDGVQVEGLTIEGDKGENVHLDGCRGGGIYLYRCPGALIQRCTARNYNGDGISFQQCNDVTVLDCLSEGNTYLGLHPGSGSQRPTITRCVARNNGKDGLYVCWRVKYGTFEDNTLENNGRFGISIGHKDTDNLVAKNIVRGNDEDGIFFRNEAEGMGGNRNRIENNLIENNGRQENAAGIRVRGVTRDLVFAKNVIRDTREGVARKQLTGILLEEKVGAVELDRNQVDAPKILDDRRATR